MKRPIKIMSRLLDAVQRRFRRARPGSILIMVVSLLVLLALIGTAAISTARLDRVSSGQNVQNTQVDLLAEGLKQMVISQLVSDLYDVKDNTSSDSLKDFFNVTDSAASDPDLGSKATRDAIIGSRVPERMVMPGYTPVVGDPPIWRSLSYPPLLSGVPLPGVATATPPGNLNSRYHFDPPNEDSSDNVIYSLQLPKLAYAPTGIALQGEIFPGLNAVFLDQNGKVAQGRSFLAADTDGDGIADALLFKLPISPIRGVTYYGAIRVVDNSAAVNINTARNPFDEHAKVTLALGGTSDLSIAGMYPASINLDGLLNSVPLVNETKPRDNQLYTGNYSSATAAAWNSQAIGDVETVKDSGVYDKSDPRNDTFFLTAGDALFHQMARRLDNPGFYDTAGDRYGAGVRPFGVSGSMSLAYGFTLVNSSAHDSLIEKVLPVSLLTTAGFNRAWSPYRADQFGLWFTNNFDYGTGNDGLIRRALITTFNPVRNDVFRHSNSTDDSKFNALYPNKTNINTAQFAELKSSFQEVMCDGPLQTPFDDDTAAKVVDPYLGMHFNPQTAPPPPPGSPPILPFSAIPELHPAEMFRSPLRPSDAGPGAVRPLQPYQVMQLRAAIAATNALAMRDPNAAPNDLVIRQAQPLVPLPGSAAAQDTTVQYQAVIYGMKRQPFITEVFLNNNAEVQKLDPNGPPPPPGGPAGGAQNPAGFAAIEIHNPYDTPLSLEGYTLKLLDRMQYAAKGMKYLELDGTPAALPIFNGADVIPPHGYMVVWNYKANTVDADTAQYLPADIKDPTLGNPASPPLVKYCAKLHNCIGKELVLLRPVVPPGGAPLPKPDALLDWAPIDSFDSTGLTAPSFVSGKPQNPVEAWHYVRANDPLASSPQFAGRAWQFVYPGRYDGSKRIRHQGTESEQWDPTTPDPWAPPGAGPTNAKSNFGLADKNNSREPVTGLPLDNSISTFPIQIGNSSMDAQFQSATPAANSKAFPIHGFARAGDVMQTPFIGSYVIVELHTPVTDPPVYAFIEANAVTMDAAFAEDTDVNDDLDGKNMPEDIGRFAPPLSYAPLTKPSDVNSFAHVAGSMDGTTGTTSFTDSVRTEQNGYWNGCNVTVYNVDQSVTAPWRRQFRHVQASSGNTITVDVAFNPPLTANTHYAYKIQTIRYAHYGWASDLLDYFTTIHAPADDYLPNVDSTPDVGIPGFTGVRIPAPDPVKNDQDPSRNTNRVGLNATPPPNTEATLPSEGLININTASWKVLSTLPLVMTGSNPATVDVKNTETLAQEIVYFRDVDDGFTPGVPHPHGPFKSLMELCMIPDFVTAMNTIDFKSGPANPPSLLTNPGIDQGDFSPLTQNPGGDLVRFDFKEKYLTLTRISNLVTLRSDCYTVYLQVQGWSDAGSANAKLMVQRRLAFIVDRSRVTPLKPTPSVYNVQVPPSGR